MNTADDRNLRTVPELKEMARELRLTVLDMVYKAQSGHIGGSFSAAEIMAALYFHILRVRPGEPRWPDRDRFVLSKGHVCPVLYACLAKRGFFPIAELDTLRKFESLLQGHPISKTPGIDVSSGSLGIGFASAVGIAIENRYAGRPSMVYTLLGDGELQEGVVWEAAQNAAKYKLDNLVAIVDRNLVQNDGVVDEIMPVEPIEDKFRAFGWTTARIDGHDMQQVVVALERARDHRGTPYCLVASTIKGKGVSFMEGDRVWHGKPPSEDQYKAAQAELSGGRA